jgi:hypothetical protein
MPGWLLIAGGVSAAAGLFNAVDEYGANRAIRRDLAQIKKYLIGLREVVDRIQQQNMAVLAALDALPERVRQLVSEVVDIALLRERYVTVSDANDNFLLLQEGQPYSLRSLEWLRFSEAMAYLFEHENRVSKTLGLISVCEVALVITKERSLALVIDRVDKRLAAMSALAEAHTSQIVTLLKKLKVELDESAYIAEHNLREDLGALAQLTYVARPDRTVEETYYVVEEYFIDGGGRYGNRSIRATRNVPRKRQVADVSFRVSRDAHVAKIAGQVMVIASELERLSQLTGLRSVLSNYRDRIGAGVTDASMLAMTMYFTDVEQSDTAKSLVAVPLDEDDFHDYIDGCEGSCPPGGLVVGSGNNKHFNHEVC